MLTFLGATYKELDKKEEAMHVFEEAIQEDCEYEEAIFNLATLEEESNQTRAIELFERAIQIDPDYGAAHERLGVTLQKRKDFTQAEYHFRRSIDIKPSNIWPHLYLANLMAVRGEKDEAEREPRLSP